MQTLRLANEDQSTVIDLIGGPIYLRTGFDFATPGQAGTYVFEPYGAQWAFGNWQTHTETFEIGIRGSSALVIGEMTRLQEFLEATRLFHAGDLAAKSCWLEWRAKGEEPKRSLLYGGTFKAGSMDNVTPGLEDCTVVGTLSLSRHALWENIQYPSSEGGINLDSLGGKVDYTGVTGNTLARIFKTVFYAGIGDDLYRFWIGIRRFNQGVANFNPLWECEDGTITDPLPGGDTAIVVDATASGGDKLQTTFINDATLISRFTITVAQVAAAYGHTDYSHFQGRYLVLCRCKVIGAGGVAGIQMHYGYTGNQIAEEVYISNTSWRLIPLGNISISPWEGTEYRQDAFLNPYRLDIYAEELVACDLDFDCLVLIPNEHLLEAEGVVTTIDNHDYIDVKEDDTEVGYAWTTPPAAVMDTLEFSLTDWYLPPGDGTIIVAAEDQASHTLGDLAAVGLYYYPRWLLYRGV